MVNDAMVDTIFDAMVVEAMAAKPRFDTMVGAMVDTAVDAMVNEMVTAMVDLMSWFPWLMQCCAMCIICAMCHVLCAICIICVPCVMCHVLGKQPRGYSPLTRIICYPFWQGFERMCALPGIACRPS